ncbi:hypothetical protein D3C86_1664550 [compost metagenome]
MFEHIRKPGVVGVVQFNDLGAVRHALHEPQVRGATVNFRVPGKPDLRVVLSDCRQELLVGDLAYVLCLVNPCDQNARLGLDAVQVVAQAGEGVRHPTVARPNEALADLEIRVEPRL